jgi:nucleoside-diphosphate-sugar epimerase
MTTLVTGATGFVGTRLVNELLSLGGSIRALIRSADKADELRGRGIETVVGDLRDPESMRRAVRDAKQIFHCAAANSKCNAEEIRETNLGGMRNLLEAVRHENGGRVILMSSINVYGSNSIAHGTEETLLCRSGEVHADVKIEGEELARQYADQHGLEITILRPGLIYGPGEFHHLPRLADAIRRGKFVFLGSRKNIVPLVYISDMIQAMLLAAETPQATGRAYSITDGSRSTIGDLVDHLARLMNCPRPMRVLPYSLAWFVCTLFDQLKRAGPINRTTLRFLGTSRFFDIQRAREELGYQPRVGLREGLEAAVDSVAQASATEHS